MIKAFAATLAILVGIGGFVIYRTGYLKPVEIGNAQQGPLVLVYKKHIGPYHKIAGVIDDVETQLKQTDLGCPLAFGRFLHDPDVTPHDRMESHGGCAFTQLKSNAPKDLKEKGYEMDFVEKREYLVATFSGSPSVGPFKVYPKVKEWMKKYGYTINGPVIELYQTTGEDSLTTRYLFPYE